MRSYLRRRRQQGSRNKVRWGLGLIRFRGHFPRGGYCVQEGNSNEAPIPVGVVDIVKLRLKLTARERIVFSLGLT